ncbi:hypothetical protein Drorol1_Dr00022490, partial [Drosera rotundifolia]
GKVSRAWDLLGSNRGEWCWSSCGVQVWIRGGCHLIKQQLSFLSSNRRSISPPIPNFFLNHHHQHSLPPQATTWLGLSPRPGQYRGSSQWERPDRGKESGDLGLGRIGVLSSVVKRVDESGLSDGGFVFLILFLNFNEQHHDDCGDDVWGLQRRIEEKTEEEEDLVMMHVRCSMICLRRVGMTVVLDCIEDGCIEGAWLWGWFAEPKHDRDRNDERGHGASQIFSRGMTEGNDESRMLWLQTRS